MSLPVQIIVGAVAAAVVLPVLIARFRTGHPLRESLHSGVQGLCALAAVDVAGAFTGVSLGLNWLSALVSLFLGLPGVIGLLCLNWVFR